MPKFQAAIFDLDGTLANTLGDLLTAMNTMLRTLHYREIDEAHLLTAINRGAREFVRKCLPEELQADEALLDQALEVYSDAYRSNYVEKTHLYPGLAEVLPRLKQAGVKLAVLSNKGDEMVKKIMQTLIPDDTFTLTWGYLDLPHKPDPTSALTIARKLGTDPACTAFIGDSDVDMKTGVNAGMVSVGVSWGYRSVDILRENGAQYIVETADELIGLLV